MVLWRFVTPGYFAALGIPIVRGRPFAEEDRGANAYAIVVSESLAKRLFPGEDALGKQILEGPKGEWFTVVGIASDVKNAGLVRGADPEYYLVRKASADVTFQNAEPPMGWRQCAVIVRTALDPKLMANSVRRMIASMDSTLPLEMETMDQKMEGIAARPRFNAALLSVFAATGVLLAATGLYGVMSFLVSQRTREIGVRMALGATPGQIMRLTLGHAARWTATGLVLGVVGSVVEARLLSSLLFQVTPGDPVAMAGSLVLLSAVAVLAAMAPARRAARLDPMEALRQE